MSEAKTVVRDLVQNRRAYHEYSIEDRWEAGIALLGSEVKSIRAGHATIAEGWVRIDPEGRVWLEQCHISPYEEANRNNHEPVRSRALLLHDHEIAKMRKGTREQGLTIIPLRLYLKGSRIKVEIGLAKGKKLHDKRESIKERDLKRERGR